MRGIALSFVCVAILFFVFPTQTRGQTTPEILAVTTATDFSRAWPEPGGLASCSRRA